MGNREELICEWSIIDFIKKIDYNVLYINL